MRLLLHGLIADVLLERAAKGDDSLGLEIAWHCMRCGRKEEATKHLLSGARVAIRKGAVHEAERRLSTGLPNITGTDRKRAVLLMAELLQEQGRWHESMEVLGTDAGVAACLHGLVLHAGAHIKAEECTPTEEEAFVALAMRALATSGEGPETYLSALSLGCGLCAQTRSTSLASQLEGAIDRLDIELFDDDQRIDIELSCLQLRYFQLDSGAAMMEIIRGLRSLSDRANAEDRPNSRSYRLLSGLAACLITTAQVEEALIVLSKAKSICEILDSPTARSSALAHMALCHGLLAQHDLQQKCAAAALAQLPRDVPSYVRLLAVYQLGLANARLGLNTEAQQLASSLLTWPRRQAPRWLAQTALLFSADILAAAGRTADAIEISWQGLAMGNGLPITRKFTGLAARWLASNLYHQERVNSATASLARLSVESVGLDVTDEVELIDAQIRGAEVSGLPTVQLRTRLADCTATLSPKIISHLRELGVRV
jgi:tetratricopeptide (TPR) repeat protein